MARSNTTGSSLAGEPDPAQAATEKPKSRGQLVVAIKPTRYVPGSGPPLRPITLLPRADTTAYIRGEFIVPKDASGDGKVHVVYLVGWTDLPSARLTIDAADILDYVSEREYEKWCHERSVERDELERKLEEEENIRAVELAILAEQQEDQRKRQDGIALRNGAFRLTGSDSSMSREASPPNAAPRKRQKKTLGTLSNAPVSRTLSLLQHESGASGPSLGETEDESSVNDEEAIFRQLQEEQDEIASETMNLQPPAKKRRTTSPQPPPLPPNRLKRSSPAPKPKAVTKPPPTSHTTAKPPPRPAHLKRESAIPVPIIPPRRPKLLAVASPTVAGPSNFPGSLSDTSNTGSSRPTSFLTPSANKNKAELNGSKHAKITNGFKPLKSLGVFSPFSTTTPQPARNQATPQQSTAKKSAKQPKTPKLDPTELVRFDANQDWEVKRLLDTKFVQEGGKQVRRFLVLWKGDWPPEQNPTWEPEENIPKKMARKFLQTHAANMGMDGAGDTPTSSRHPPWRPERTFSSVSEAFAGDTTEEERYDGDDAVATLRGRGWRAGVDDARRYDQEGDDEEMLLVTEDPTPYRTPFTPSNLDWEMAMGRRFGESLAG